jgi:hypothetical protein
VTFEQQLREWAAAGRTDLVGTVTVAGFGEGGGVMLGLQQAHRYVALSFAVSGNMVTPLTEPVPPTAACPTCGGDGAGPPGALGLVAQDCPACDGTGIVPPPTETVPPAPPEEGP